MSGFASTKDLAEKTVSFDELAPGLFGYTAEGDPNSGVVVGEDGVLVVDAQATPAMAADVIARIRTVTDKPVRHVVLTHYHAVRVLGASGYKGAEIIASDVTRAMIAGRGQQDMDSEIGRFPRLFRGKDSIPGLTWPTLTFDKRMSLFLGQREVQIIHIGRSHTAGDTVVWLPKERVLFSGDVVEYGATPYCGDAHFTDWPATLDAARALGAEALVPGRGRSLMNRRECEEAIEGTRAFTSDLFAIVKAAGKAPLKEVYDKTMQAMRPKYGEWVIFEHCMPFNVTRAYDEAQGLDTPRIWTAERDVEMWRALEQGSAGADGGGSEGAVSEILQPMSEAEYLAWSERQEITYEFDGSRPIAMNGGTLGHELVQGNLKFELIGRLRGGRCSAFGPDTRVPTGQGRYRFPDAVVACGPFDPAGRDVTEPVVIFEIMSESTLKTDRGAKLVEYRALPSLVRYVMLEQSAAMATVVTRVGDIWSIDVLRGGEVLRLPEIGIELPVAHLYIGLPLPPEEP